MHPREIDLIIRDFAERQHGVVARRQLIAAGITPHAVDLRLGRGRLCSIHRGVYAVGHLQLGLNGRRLAAVLACGPGAALSHRSAGRLWGLIGYPRSARTEVTRPRRFRPRPGTILDLAAVVSRPLLERAMNEADVRGLTGRRSLPHLLDRYPGRRGSSVLRDLLREETRAQGVTRSELEERFSRLIEANRLPRPRLNAGIAVRGRFLTVDCVWDPAGLVVELDGRAAHRTARAFEEDREPDRALLAAGWQVMRVTWRQLEGDAAALVRDLTTVLVAPGPAPRDVRCAGSTL
jgi:very-short-patch-repair endonuclease